MNLPLLPGVYIMKNKNKDTIYIGKAKILKNRVSSYFGSDKNHSDKVVQMVLNVVDFEYIITDSEFEALVLENSMIKQYQPKYNILLKDDKGYSYIKIGSGDYPRLSEAKKAPDDGNKYMGPYVSSFMVKNNIDEATDIFKLPTCNKVFPRDFKKTRPCLNYYIKKCMGLCKGRISRSEYGEIFSEAIDFIKGGSADSIKELTKKMEEASENLEFEKAAALRDKINLINSLNEKQKIFAGTMESQDVIVCAQSEKKAVVTILKFRNYKLCDREDHFFEAGQNPLELIGEFIERYYQSRDIPQRITVEELPESHEIITEWLKKKRGKNCEIFVPQKGDQYKILEMCKNNAAEKLAESTKLSGKDVSALDEMGRMLGLSKPPTYIEAYDISNLSGSEVVGGMVVFKDGRPYKKAYRRFKIKTVEGQDDYASMREVIQRRFNEYELKKDEEEGFGKMPDLILLDGGKNHVSVVLPIIKSFGYDVPLFGMVKDSKHKTRAIASVGDEIEIHLKRKTFTLISQIQEEVHRFAISYHRNLRKKNSISSSLTEIEGIGKAKAIELMKKFKTIKNISEASLEEIESVKGINRKMAENIKIYFNREK